MFRLGPRLLVLLLSALPAVWGNCPCWFTDANCCGTTPARASAPTPRPCCARCAKRAQAARTQGETPARECAGCDGCPSLVARYGASTVPPTVTLPEDVGIAALVPVPPESLFGLRVGTTGPRERVPWPDPAGPPSPAETTALLL